MARTQHPPDQVASAVGNPDQIGEARLQRAPVHARRAAALAQWRIEQAQRESKLTADQRLTMLEELAQIAYRLHGPQRSTQDESPAALLAMRAQLRAADRQ